MEGWNHVGVVILGERAAASSPAFIRAINLIVQRTPLYHAHHPWTSTRHHLRRHGTLMDDNLCPRFSRVCIKWVTLLSRIVAESELFGTFRSASGADWHWTSYYWLVLILCWLQVFCRERSLQVSDRDAQALHRVCDRTAFVGESLSKPHSAESFWMKHPEALCRHTCQVHAQLKTLQMRKPWSSMCANLWSHKALMLL